MNLNNRFLSVLEKYRRELESNSSLNSFELEYFHNFFVFFQRARESEWPEVISYYCTANVGESVIGKGRMWLNDVRKMNDKTEMTFAVEYIGKELSRIKKNDDAHQGLVTVIEKSYKDLTDSSIWKDTLTYNNNLILAMCFTQAMDDAAMWDRYGDSGKGVSIRFNLKKLSRVVMTAGLYFPNPLPFEHGVTCVCYGGENCTCVNQLHNHALEAYADAKTNEERE